MKGAGSGDNGRNVKYSVVRKMPIAIFAFPVTSLRIEYSNFEDYSFFLTNFYQVGEIVTTVCPTAVLEKL